MQRYNRSQLKHFEVVCTQCGLTADAFYESQVWVPTKKGKFDAVANRSGCYVYGNVYDFERCRGGLPNYENFAGNHHFEFVEVVEDVTTSKEELSLMKEFAGEKLKTMDEEFQEARAEFRRVLKLLEMQVFGK